MRTIDLLYQAYVDERMESTKAEKSRRRFASLEIYAVKQITAS